MAAAHPFGAFVGCRFKRIGIADFARLQKTTSQIALTLCHAVFRVLRLFALLGPALRPPASQCAPGLTVLPCLLMCYPACFCVALPVTVLPCLLLYYPACYCATLPVTLLPCLLLCYPACCCPQPFKFQLVSIAKFFTNYS